MEATSEWRADQRPIRERGIARRLHPLAIGISLVVLGSIAVFGQEGPRPGGDPTDAAVSYPRLPGAITRAPDWIGADAPFDVARFFAVVPRDRNAAPLYLDAFFEFSTEVAVCFPEGPARDQRSQAAADRMKRYMVLYEQLRNDPEAVPPEAIDAVIGLYDTGFRKLAEAQRRDRCAFEAGLGSEALVPHASAARQVARVASLRVRRAVERKDYDAAIREVEAVLRPARDLQPRGPMMNQLVVAAIIHVVCGDPVKTILVGPGLRVEDCDRLLKLLLDHEASSTDGYVEGLRAEYLTNRTALRKHTQLAVLTTAAQRDRVIRDINDYYRALLGLDGQPYAGRIEAIARLKVANGNDPLSRMVAMLVPAIVSFVQAMGRVTATLRATECLVVMRRWELTHRGSPRALTVAVREAGLKAVPTDPYDGKPMRMALLEGQPVIYSVGEDGRDDGAQVDSKYDTRPGDLSNRLPTMESRR